MKSNLNETFNFLSPQKFIWKPILNKTLILAPHDFKLYNFISQFESFYI